MRRCALMYLLGLAVAAFASAQAQLTLDPIACVPQNGHTVATATASGAPGGSEVRFYFRRLHDVVEDFYYIIGHQDANGRYWGALPDPEDEKVAEHRLRSAGNAQDAEAQWWKQKESSTDRDPNGDLDDAKVRERASVGKQEPRAWLAEMDNAALQAWLDRLENEPVEYFAALVGAGGEVLAKAPMRVAEVRRSCPVTLTPQQQGAADNNTIGETAAWQARERVFHWQCDGIVSRLGPTGILRADEFCRTCVVAAWPKALIPGLLAAGGIIVVIEDEPPPASPSRP